MTRLLAFSHVAFGLQLTQQIKTSKKVTYISNLEGDLDQLILSLTNSDIKVTWWKDPELKWAECTELTEFKEPWSQLACWPKLDLPEGEDQFVFGGNLFDHGMGDIRLANMFIKLYEECIKEKLCDPNDEDKGEDKLYYILGNRDILKMRYALDTLTDLQAVTWDTQSNPIDLKGIDKTDKVSLRKEQLSKSSGATESFEFRRKEIELLVLDDDIVTDEEVADSFQWMTGVNAHEAKGNAKPMAGLYKEYLKYADLIVKIDSTIYSHGAITKENFLQEVQSTYFATFFDPVPLKSVDNWIRSLRKLDDDMIDEWATAIDGKTFDQKKHLYPGFHLLTYMMAHFSQGKTVVESTIMKKFEMDTQKTFELADKYSTLMTTDGVKRFVGGFRSPGPVPVSDKQLGIEFWNANMNFDGIGGFKSKGKMSRRNGWARLEITDDEAKIVNQLPSNQ